MPISTPPPTDTPTAAAPYYADAALAVHHGDCLEVLRRLPDSSVDAVVTDPPYGLEFMGKTWDTFGGDIRQPGDPTFTEGTGPYGRAKVRHGMAPAYKSQATATSRQEGGISQATGPSFLGGLNPKCLRCDRWQRGSNPCDCTAPEFTNERLPRLHAFQEWCETWSTECLRVLRPGGHLLAFGGSRTWHRLAAAIEDAGFEIRDSIAWLYGSGFPKSLNLVDEAGERTGWGTALKPAFEPVVVARKPLAGNVAANVLAHGTGALNIDGCRVGTESTIRATTRLTSKGLPGGGYGHPDAVREVIGKGGSESGRWPANVVLDEQMAGELDAQSGESAGVAGGMRQVEGKVTFTVGEEINAKRFEGGDKDFGGASRFFFIAREDNEPCPSTNAASIADSPSSHLSAPADSAPSGAATTASPGGERLTDSPSTSATPSASRPSDESGTPQTTPIESESSHDSQRAKPSQMVSRARYAAGLTPTDITTTTTGPSTSDGSAALTTSSTTPTSVPGVPLDELGSRFKYVAKADSSERVRVNGTAHPTVKPLALMRWLVRLVTPPGGTVLEPFAGSGTTVEACILEGFRCIAIEREADYLPLITQRIHRRRDPVAAVKAAETDGGLFDLLGEATA